MSLQIPASNELPNQQRAIEIFKEEKPAIEMLIDQRVRDAATYPVEINGKTFILAKTTTCHIVQPVDDWTAHRKTGFCISFDNKICVCDEKPDTVQAVQMFAHAIYFLGHPR